MTLRLHKHRHSNKAALKQLLSWQLLDVDRDKMTVILPLVLRERCHFTFILFSNFGNRDTTGVGAWAAENGYGTLAEITKQHSSFRFHPLFHLHHLIVTSRKAQIEVPFEFKSYGFFLSTLQLLNSVLSWVLQSISPFQPEMQNFVSLKIGFSSLGWIWGCVPEQELVSMCSSILHHPHCRRDSARQLL